MKLASKSDVFGFYHSIPSEFLFYAILNKLNLKKYSHGKCNQCKSIQLDEFAEMKP